MKSKIVLLTSISALLVSVAGANAFEYRPFVGVSMGIQGAAYSDDGEDLERVAAIDLPTDFFAFGIETGVRAGAYDDIYNGGITLSATKTTYSKVQQKYVEDKAGDEDLLNISMTYDNYIRISGDKESRIDLVLGAGFGTMAYHYDAKNGGSDTVWSFAPEFKVGLDFGLTHSVILSANFRAILPTRDHYEFDLSYIAGGSVKYLF